MLVRSSIFSQMSGKFNGAVAMDGRAGQSVRAHAIPANPKTEAQLVVRNALRQVMTQFHSPALDKAQRDAWVAYASGETLSARLGGTYRPTAAQAFVAVNAIRVQLGLPAVLTPPPHGKAMAAVAFAWAGEELTMTYAAPAAGMPDAYAAGGGLRLHIARRPIYHARRYGSWDTTLVVLGAATRPAPGSMLLAAGMNGPVYKLFYRLVGSTPTGQPVSAMEGVVMGTEE